MSLKECDEGGNGNGLFLKRLCIVYVHMRSSDVWIFTSNFFSQVLITFGMNLIKEKEIHFFFLF